MTNSDIPRTAGRANQQVLIQMNGQVIEVRRSDDNLFTKRGSAGSTPRVQALVASDTWPSASATTPYPWVAELRRSCTIWCIPAIRNEYGWYTATGTHTEPEQLMTLEDR